MSTIITLDFETYWAQDYTLSKMTTESYIRDPRFQTIGLGIKFDRYPTDWIEGPDVARTLKKIDWSDKLVLAHNMAFDGAILNWHYGIRPRLLLDTMSMARPFHMFTCGVSLAALAEEYQLRWKGQGKGTEVINAKDKRFEDFTPEELARYGEYCIADVELTRMLFDKLAPQLPADEIALIDLMLRMFTEPVLELNPDVLKAHLAKVQARKAKLLKRIGFAEDRSLLMSDDKFAAVLRALGVEPPMKHSLKATNPDGSPKLSYAFAKTDDGFKELLEHEDMRVQAVAAARLGVKSTLEETRTEAFLGIAQRGPLPIMLNYCGAHTTRASGGDKINLQNLPRGGALRYAMEAPEGHAVVAADSSQIEARGVAWLAGQEDLVQQFAEGADIYSSFASEVYGYPVDRKAVAIGEDGTEYFPHKEEGFVGKTAILGLGFGMGGVRFQGQLRSQAKVVKELDWATDVVNLYRKRFPAIPALWRKAGNTLRSMVATAEFQSDFTLAKFGPTGCIEVRRNQIWLPHGLPINYPNLSFDGKEYTYTQRRKRTRLHGPKVVENITQGFARGIVFLQMLRIDRKLKAMKAKLGHPGHWRVVLTVHDEVVVVVPVEAVEWARQMMTKEMSRTPAWAAGMPLACETSSGKSYGDAK